VPLFPGLKDPIGREALRIGKRSSCVFGTSHDIKEKSKVFDGERESDGDPGAIQPRLAQPTQKIA